MENQSRDKSRFDVQKARSICYQAVFDCLEAIDTPVALGIYIRLRERCYVLPDVRPIDYRYPTHYALDIQAVSLVKKAGNWHPAYSRKDAEISAWKKFRSCEVANADTNRRLLRFRVDPSTLSDSTRIIVYRARQIVERIVKRAPSIGDVFRFGPGSTYELQASCSTLADKVSQTIVRSTKANARFYTELVKGSILDPLSPKCWQQIVACRGNRFAVVPKQFDIGRPACIEPDANIVTQLALGGILRRRLYEATSIDITSATDVHRHWLQCIDPREYATLDLSSASDLISFELVRFLVPRDWFLMLCACRSPETEVGADFHGIKGFKGNVWLKNQKFSSMGNGFTFELETILFWALARATEEYVEETNAERARPFFPLMFGDDHIMSPKGAAFHCSVLEELGLEVNRKKTFLTGPFRESCGVDRWDRIDCRQIYLDGDIDGKKEVLIFANKIAEISEKLFGAHPRQTRFRRAWSRVAGILGNSVPRGPAGHPETFLHDVRDWVISYNTRRHGPWVTCIKGWLWVPNTDIPDQLKFPAESEGPQLAYALIGGQSEGSLIRSAITRPVQHWFRISGLDQSSLNSWLDTTR